jgi:PAS domain S-box-containing protein
MAHRDPSSPTPMPALLRYGIAGLSVAIAIGLDFFLLQYFEAKLTPFLFAVAATVWYAGTGPGVLATILSVLSLNYFFLPPFFSFSPISYADLVYLTFCAFCALAVGWVRAVRRRAEQDFRQARQVALENARLYREVAEREKQLTATSEVLRTILNAPSDIQSALNAVAEHAARLCGASNARIWRLEDNVLRLVASYGESLATMDGREGLPADRDTVTGRAACDRRTVHVHDIAAEGSEYPVGSRLVKDQGWHTTLATPLLREGTPVGIILVRRMEVRPFHDQQIALLEMFADQAAIAIENVRLFEAEKQRTLALARANCDLAEREAKIRRLVDSNIIGIYFSGLKGRVLEANDAFLHLVGHDRDDLVSGRIRWTDLTPPEWRERDKRALAELISNTIAQPYEKEFFRKDGSRVPVLVGGALFEEGGNEGVAFVLDLTDRKCAEQALRESEYKLRQIIDTVPGHLWSANPAFEPTHLNRHLLDYFGRRFEDFKEGGWEAFLHPDDLPETAKAISHAVQTGTYFQVVHRLRRANGEFRWHHARGEPLRDQQGRIIQWYGLSVDIDEGKNAEDQLRRSEAYLAEAQSLSHSGVSAYNETAILYGSEETYRIWGFDPAQGVPSREAVFQRIHPDDRDRLNAEVQRAVSEKRGYSAAYRIVLPDGTIKHLETIGRPAFSANGKLIEIVTTQIDVTERKLAEEALRESEAKIRRLVDSNIIGIFIWDFDGRILEANDEFLRMVSYDREDLLAGSIWWTDLTPPDWRDRNNARIEQQKGGGRFEPFEKEFTRKNGSRVPILIGGATFEEHGNQGVAFVLDLTERKRVEAEARENERRYREAQLELAHANRVATMGQLTASITHEVNQPITAAVTYALAARRFLSAQPPNVHEVDDALSLIVKEGNRAGEVVGRIRALIKKAPARKEAVEINDAILEVIVLTRTEAANNSVSVRTQLAEALPHVQGDRVQLQQVLLNLIINAIEAMCDVGEEKRELLISTRNEPDGVSVEVRDSGPGFAPAALERVFEAFYTTKPGGLGLGLSICRSIIEAHNGRLWASPNVPRGAVFGFIAPAHPAAAS